MPIRQPQLFLLAYDIANPKRLQRVHRVVRAEGIPIQYSVFLILASPLDLDALLHRLDDIIHPTEDDIRVYPLPAQIEVTRYGRQHLPLGLDLITGDRLRDALLSIVGTPDAE